MATDSACAPYHLGKTLPKGHIMGKLKLNAQQLPDAALRAANITTSKLNVQVKFIGSFKLNDN